MKLFTDIEAELKLLVDKAKAAWDRGEKELHDLLHGQAKEVAASAAATVTPSGNQDGVLTVSPPAHAEPDANIP
jgi:hypothetical protein